MEEISTKPKIIEKESVRNLKFPAEDVLLLPEKIMERKKAIGLATRLGNNYKGKVKIVFEDNEGIKEVRTTIWANTQNNVILKSGLMVPIHRIHSVKIF